MAATNTEAPAKRHWRLPVLEGVLPIDRKRIPTEVVAGITLAALAIPEVMGYATIAGMPVITGLYTILLPMLAFALLGSSRHLVVGADSATAAVMAAGLTGLAVAGTTQWIALAGMLALLAAGFLILARLIGLGFLADFLSRTVLIGFLTGVGIEVALGQVGGLLGIPEGKGVTIHGHQFGGAIGKLISTLQGASQVSWATVAVSAAVIVVILFSKYVTKAVPGALIAVVGAIFVSWKWNLAAHGVATLGKVAGGLPHLGLPSVPRGEIPSLLGTAASIFVLILAQSAATSRAYAAKYNDEFSEDTDLVGLGASCLFAGISGTFVVNGSPTKTQMVDGAGGRSQLSQITTGVIVAVVLLFLTAPIQYMPKAVLAAVVFLIGIELVDIAGMTRIERTRRDEFVVATLTALTVIVVGVEQGIVLAIVISIINHLRRSYHPNTTILEPPTDLHDGWRSVPLAADTRTMPGLVVMRFAADLYYANANRFLEDVRLLVGSTAPLRWLCIDAASLTDVDYSGGQTLRQVLQATHGAGVTLVFCEMMSTVKTQLDRYGLQELTGDDVQYPDIASAVAAYRGLPEAPAATS